MGAGINIHLVAFFNDQGISPGTAALLLTVWSVGGTVTGVPAGFLAERLPIKTVLGVVVLAMGLVTLWLSQVDSVTDGYVWAVLSGTLWGPMATLNQLLLPEYFGRHAIGALRGLTMATQMMANALGPLAAALAFDRTGGYGLIFSLFIGIYACMGFILLVLLPPHIKSTGKAPAGS